MFLDGLKDKHDPIVTASFAHAEPQRGVAYKLLSKAERFSLDKAKQTLQATTQLNKPDADSGI